MTKQIHAGELIGKVLKDHGVEFLFTLCGGHISPILIGSENHGIRIIDTRSEANAVFAADAVARLSGIPGVATVTAGPGLTNTVTALMNAKMAESPVIILGGATATILKGRGSLQDIDQLSLVKPLTKWHKTVKTVADIVPTLNLAFQKAQSDVMGPVYVELPIDLLYPEKLIRGWYGVDKKPRAFADKILQWYLNRKATSLFKDAFIKQSNEPLDPKTPRLQIKKIEDAVELMAYAHKPVMLIGSQVMVSPAKTKDIVTAIEKLEIPVYLSGMARGLLGKEHPQQLRHKRRDALRDADLVILIGVPLDFRLDYGRHIKRKTPIISVNRNKSTLNLNRSIRRIRIKIHSDPADFLVKFAEMAVLSDWSVWKVHLRELNKLREEQIAKFAKQKTKMVNPLYLCQEIEKIIDDDSILIGDGGDFVASISYIVQPRGPLRWLDPGAFGTLGPGGGFAIGSKLLNPDSEVWIFYGDGSAAYSLSEFDTMARHGIPVIAVVGNDASWNQIAREQVEIFDTDLGTKLVHNDYHTVVEGYGGEGLLISKKSEVKTVLKEAKALAKSGKPVLINVMLGITDFRKGSISM